MKKIALLFCLGMWAVSPFYGQGNGGSVNSPTNNGNGNGNNPNQNALRWDRQGNTVDTSEFIGTINQQPLKVKTGNQERMRITPDGKVGIGIWNPLEKFDVLGTIRSREDIKVDGNIFVNGTSNFYGEALFSGNVRMSGLQNATDLSSGEIIVRGDGDVLKKLPILELADIVYQPRLCLDDDPTWLPTWSHGPGKIYSLCAKVGVLTDNPEFALDINGQTRLRNHLMVGNISEPQAFVHVFRASNNMSSKLLLIENQNRVLLQLDNSGMLRARTVKIDMENWADYVFESNYPLLPIEDLKEFIEVNKHLPNIPSAQVLSQDGMDVGDINRLLMEKIEELTLYLIQQNEKIDEMSTELTKLKLLIQN